jgi:hypothetical protein
MSAPQMRQKLKLRVIADRVVRAIDLDASLIKLQQQLVDRYLQYLGKL